MLPGSICKYKTHCGDTMQNLISMRDISAEDILAILARADAIEYGRANPDMNGKVMANIFYEPSTRTQLSFESAMKKLGGEVITMQGTKGTSVEKGETLSDTVSVIAQYADIIVIRHRWEGAARYVSEVVDIPVVNAGDGANQHPTQCLLDLYSIQKTQGTLENLNVVLAGDLKYGRTVHSLIFGLAPFNPTFHFVSPPSLRIPQYYKEELTALNISFTEGQSLGEIEETADILYMTRIQRERFPDPEEYNRVKNAYQLRRGHLNKVKENFKILHPLPRVNEIHTDVDETPYAYYFEQARNGVYTRQAIIATLAGGSHE
jgi:aspartate carbamoyltransferase catalytic subunit